ncbi:MAG: NAD(P)H-binding protein [Sedimenticolaceae bacterium]
MHDTLEWCVVRPDTLTNDTEAIGYEVFRSPVCSAIFDPGRISRLNVARFMADLLTDEDTWNQWHGQMPVIYGKT